MALIACKDCSKEFSSDAKSCPNCGAKKPKKPSRVGKLLGYLFLAAFGFSLLMSMAGNMRTNRPAQESAEDQSLAMARYTCAQYIKKNLNDPDSAELGMLEVASQPAEALKNGVFHVQVHTHARNGFNALRKVAFDCKVKRLPSGDWVLLYLKEYD